MHSSEHLDGQHRGGFFSSCVLLMLRAGERDTAELRELMTVFGFHRHVETLEATLGQLKEEALVDGRPAHVAADAHGQHRWRLTAKGEEWLATRQAVLAEPGRLVSRFLQCHSSGDDGGDAGVRDRASSHRPTAAGRHQRA